MAYFNPSVKFFLHRGKVDSAASTVSACPLLCGWVLGWREEEVHSRRGAGNTSLLEMTQATFRASCEATHGGTHL